MFIAIFEKYKKNYLKYTKLKNGFSYNSRDNDFYNVPELKKNY